MLWTVPVLHPAFTFRNPLQLGPLQAHVTNFVHRAVFGFPKPPKIELNPDVRRLHWLVKMARLHKLPISIDVEAAPPDGGRREWARIAKFARLRAFGVGIALGPGYGMSWFVPCHPQVWAEFKRICADKTLTKCFANGYSYDIPLLGRYNVKFAGPIEDIRDGRRALVSTSRVSLMAQAAIYLCVGPWKAEAMEDESDMKGFVDATRIKRKRLLTYNGKDCVFTSQVERHQHAEFREDPDDMSRRLRLYKQQLRLAQAASKMQWNGFGFDWKRQKTLAKELRDIAHERDLVLAKLVRPFSKVQLGKPDQKLNPKGGLRISYKGGVNENDLAALIYAQCARPGIRSFELEVPMSDKCWTEGGKPSVDRNALLFLMATSNIPDELRQIIYAAWKADAPRKALSTYVESDKVLAAVGPDGRIHPQYNSCGAETGRWSCSDPNLFNLSEEKEDDPILGDLPNIRDLYVAPPGYVIVHRDWKGLELEVMCDFTGDKALREALDYIDPIKKEPDAHSYRARKWFSMSDQEEVPKRLRKMVKMVGFGSNYGGASDTVYLGVLAQMPDASYEDVEALHAAFPTLHKGIASHWNTSVAFAEAHGYNEEPVTNRRRYYPPGMPLKPTETSNYAIQGGAAGIANSTMVGYDEKDYANSVMGTLERKFPKAWLAMHTYDSFDIICPKSQAKEIDQMLNEKMSGPWKVGKAARPFLSDGDIGNRWSEV